RDREPGPGVAAVEDVVRRLGPTREAADAVERAQGAEPLETPGQQLVRIRLMTGIPDDAVARRFEQSVERDRELDDTQRGAEMAPGLGDGRDDGRADIGGELRELGLIEATELGGVAQLGEDGHGSASSSQDLSVCLPDGSAAADVMMPHRRDPA